MMIKRSSGVWWTFWAGTTSTPSRRTSPVPGSAVSRDELREAQYKAHIDGIRDRVNNIQARKGESVQEKVRHETTSRSRR